MSKLVVLVGGLLIYTSHAFGGYSKHQHPSFCSRHAVVVRIKDSALRQASHEDDIVVQLPLLEAELTNLKQRENNGRLNSESVKETSITDATQEQDRKQELQDQIQNAKSAAELGVRRAQMEFYEAFSAGDVEAMRNVWSDGENVRCIHPGFPCIDGKAAIMTSWEMILRDSDQNDEMFAIEPSRVKVDICGLSLIHI